MPALVQPQSAMQEPESPWTNSFKSSLGKRQREGEDDAGRLTAGMNGIMSMATMPTTTTTTTTMTMQDVGYGNGSRDMMGIAVHQVHQESNGSINRFGMKRLKSTSVSVRDCGITSFKSFSSSTIYTLLSITGPTEFVFNSELFLFTVHSDRTDLARYSVPLCIELDDTTHPKPPLSQPILPILLGIHTRATIRESHVAEPNRYVWVCSGIFRSEPVHGLRLGDGELAVREPIPTSYL